MSHDILNKVISNKKGPKTSEVLVNYNQNRH